MVVGGQGTSSNAVYTTETFVLGESSSWTIHRHLDNFGSEDMNLATVDNVVYSLLGIQ